MQRFCNAGHHSWIERKCGSIFVRALTSGFMREIVLTPGRIMWVIGGIIAAAGMQVYIVWGTVSFPMPAILLVKAK